MSPREKLLRDLEALPEPEFRVVEHVLEALRRERPTSESEDIELAERGLAEYADQLRHEDER
jgi:hypothetical protein